MSDRPRPRLAVERAIDGEISWDEIPEHVGAAVGFACRFPHCDSKILHLPEECVYCADCAWLQEERARVDVSNTGHANRSWPCPADRARASEVYNRWGGNRARRDP